MEKLTGIHNEVLEEQSRVTRRLNYIEQAFSAYRAKDYKQCILLLRGVELDDIESVSILVDAAYDFWVSVQEDSAHGEHRSGWKEKTNDQLEAVGAGRDDGRVLSECPATRRGFVGASRRRLRPGTSFGTAQSVGRLPDRGLRG